MREPQILEIVIGMFYDSVPLMKNGQAARTEAISLAKAMVHQALVGERNSRAIDV
jgi:hypothetical protein